MLDNFDIARNASPNYSLPYFNNLFFSFYAVWPGGSKSDFRTVC